MIAATTNPAEGSKYTDLHLSGIAFLHPPSPPNITQCPCEAQTPEEGRDQEKHFRVYHNEPSGYGYNSGNDLIKESRFSTLKGWYAPSDDLVADDAAPGGPVVAIGWWAKNEVVGEEIWETRVYYLGKEGIIRERTNRSYFAPTTKEDFEVDLPEPRKLVPPVPGWKLTPLGDPRSEVKPNTTYFPTVVPLPYTSLGAARSEDGSIHVIYQAKDESVRELAFYPGKGWTGQGSDKDVVVCAGKAKPGTPLTAVAGGWLELRVFCVNKDQKLLESYSDGHTKWGTRSIPYTLSSTAMLSAVAWNFASPFFQIRVYFAAANDDLHELSFSRNSGGWGANHRGVNSVEPEELPGVHAPLSAVAAVLVPGEWKTKVFFHPRRKVIAEWDVCARDSVHAGITKVSAGAKKKRQIEEETRLKIKEEEEEERKKQQQQAKVYKNVSDGSSIPITDQKKLENIQKISKCTKGYSWRKVPGGWQCEGGSHSITDEEFDRA